MKSHHVDLLNEAIAPALTRLALPILATSLVQMLYNLTDMAWIGRLGAGAVTAVGSAGMYTWFSQGFAILARTGGQVKTAHCLGAGENDSAAQYARGALQLGILFAVLYGLVSLFGASRLIGFFKLNSPEVIAQAEWYVRIACGLVIFSYLNAILTGLLTAAGNSRTPFIVNVAGLVFNVVLDPVLIFGIGPFPVLRVTGAAIATVIAQMIVTVMFFIFAMKDTVLFQYVRYLKKPDLHHMKGIVRIGFPTSVQSMLFTGISMIIARLVAGYGDAAVAVQKVGSQIESISWMTADGFAAAVNSFTSQNHGAGKKRRIYQGYVSALKVVFVWGIFCTLLLICCPAPVFRIFITEKDVIPLGVDYLRILGVSQLFMSLEITTAGAFSGYGKTVPPSVISIVFTALRIPLALILVHTTLALNGIWWSITISSILKGVLLFVWFYIFMRGEKLIYNRK